MRIERRRPGFHTPYLIPHVSADFLSLRSAAIHLVPAWDRVTLKEDVIGPSSRQIGYCMFRLNKLTDYALVVMQYVAKHPEVPLHTARGLAAATELPVPTVVKILKELLDHRLLVSHRGVKGGYAPARLPADISVAEIIEAFEGSIGLTECATSPGRCELEGRCNVQDHSAVIGRALYQALGNISLFDLTIGLGADSVPGERRSQQRNDIVSSIALASTAGVARRVQ